MEQVAGYGEDNEHPRNSAVPLSHVSIEVGHFLMPELLNGVDSIRAQFQRIVPLLDGYRRSAALDVEGGLRVSTCFLIDDYFRPDTDPRTILPKILEIAEDCGLTIDYLAREAGCAVVPKVVTGGITTTPEIELAAMVAEQVVAEPREGDNGQFQTPSESGWLCNGKRGVSALHPDPGQAMHPGQRFERPEEFGRRYHSVFLDVEMWSPLPDGRRRWSCPYLASIWQLMRLGMLRYHGQPVVKPLLWEGDRRTGWPASWAELPAVMQLTENAQPFAAYRSLSILPERYVGIEHAVRVIIDHIQLDPDVVSRLVARGRAEKIEVRTRTAERLGHLLMVGS